jgi:multidrug efflux pump subunit AcrB
MEQKPQFREEQYKEFGASTFSVNNITTVYVLSVIIFLSGLMAYISMPSETFPEIIIPNIYVGTPYPGNSPSDIEKLITRPLEKEINGISGIDKITSTSVEGFSTIMVEFDFSVTPDDALRKVKDKVDVAMGKSDFPQDLPADPNVFEMNLSELTPIQNINLSGDFSLDQLNEYAEYLEERIEDLPEISKVDIRGMDDKEVRISIDLYKMESLNISFDDVAGAISNENRSISGGNLLVDGYRRNIRVVGDFKSMADIQDVIIKHEKGNLVYLRDVAQVSFTEVDAESFAREYGKPVVMLDVIKRAGENLIIVSEKIDAIIAEAKVEYLPKNLDVSITNDQSYKTKTQLSELENSIIFGVLLVVLVLMFFLGLRNALFVGIAIPLSMLMSFLILNMLGITLNTIVLFSLVLALGMLVDNGIVIVENIYRLMDEGVDREKAAKFGAGEVAMPIIASTATTLAAFVPLAFWPGIFGEFMRYLPLTLIIVLSSSLFVALVINPGLTAALMKVKEEQPNKKKWTTRALLFIIVGIVIGYAINAAVEAEILWLGNLFLITGVLILSHIWVIVPLTERFQASFLPRLEEFYRRMLAYALRGRNPYLFFAGSFVLLFLSFVLLGTNPPKTLFFPENQPNMAMVYIELPIGTDILETNIATIELEERVNKIVESYNYMKEVDGKQVPYNYMVESIIAQVGEGTSDPNQGPSMAQTPNKSKITVAFRQFGDRLDQDGNLHSSADVLEEIRSAIGDYPGAQIVVDKDAAGPPAGAPINLEISGDDYEKLIALAQDIRTFIEESGVAGIEELKLDVEEGKPEMPIEIDRAKARALGISTAQIGSALRTALFGREVSRYKDGEDDYPINVRINDKYRYNIDDLMDQKITFRDQADGKIKQVPISAVAKAKKTSTFSAIKRNDLKRQITLQSNVLGKYNPTEINNKLKEVMLNFEMPEGYTYSFTGEQEKQAEQMAFLSSALVIAVFLIFLILVTQFNSASTPFIILITVVLSLIGVLFGLVIFRMDFVIMMTMIGIISLAGIVVNNAIVLIDYINQLMERKKEDMGMDKTQKLPIREVYLSIVQAGKTRLRPVLLTAITTVLGLFPLATGMNINFFTLISENDPQIYFGGDNVVFWGPMSWTVIFGLSFATFLTLIVVPVMFYILTRVRYRIAGEPL